MKDRSKKQHIPLVVILGPSAVGKSEIAIELAKRWQGEIVSADSRLFYRGMDIGTGKPTQAERNIIQHHLIDVASPDETWSLADFQRAACKAINEIFSRGHIPFLVGGTGQYLRAVLEQWVIPMVKPNPRMRECLSVWATEISPKGLHTRLAVLDPQAAIQIDSCNLRRTIRALEVVLTTGQRFSRQREISASPYRVLIIGLTQPRPELYARIDQRIQKMLEAGFVNEVRNLLDLGYSPSLPSLSAIGYKEIVDYIQGLMSLEKAVAMMKKRTRIFIRHQANWFKEDDSRISWFQVAENTVNDIDFAINRWLSERREQ